MAKFYTSTLNSAYLNRQRGAVLLIMLVILIVGGTAILVNALSNVSLQFERERKTYDALEQAKEALIGYAAAVRISNSTNSNQPRPGELLCPDNHPLGDINEGSPSTPCNSNALGRLPWKKLGLPDLRDASGERLWYALSTNFKNTNRSGTLNSDTLGTITVYSASGSLLNDATSNTGAVAVIIAPGEPLARLDSGTMQDRSSSGYNIASNYLDTPSATADLKDNATFTDGSLDGLTQGKIKDANNKVILNDQILVITADSIMNAAQKRVSREVMNCLDEYALANNGRYPWAVQLSSSSYQDNSNQFFGRIPDLLTNTQSSSGGGMISGQWGPACNTHQTNSPSTWWQNWKSMVFYGLSKAYKPGIGIPFACSTTTCLAVNPLSATIDKKYVVIVAGKALASLSQLRPSSNLTDYLEGSNANANQTGNYTSFIQAPVTSVFNDTLVYKQ